MIILDKNVLMNYVDDYPTCERTDVSLRIYSKTMTPSMISLLLGVSPTSGFAKGHIFPSGRSRVSQFSSWILSSEEFVRSLDSRRHLDWLLAKIEPVSGALIDLQNREGVTMWVTCVWWSVHGGGGPRFWPHQLHKLGTLNLEFEIDYAFYGDESDS